MNAFLVHFQSVLISPLLPFLTNSLVNNYNPIVAKAANDRLRDAGSCAYLGKAGKMTYCIYHIGSHGVM